MASALRFSHGAMQVSAAMEQRRWFDVSLAVADVHNRPSACLCMPSEVLLRVADRLRRTLAGELCEDSFADAHVSVAFDGEVFFMTDGSGAVALTHENAAALVRMERVIAAAEHTIHAAGLQPALFLQRVERGTLWNVSNGAVAVALGASFGFVLRDLASGRLVFADAPLCQRLLAFGEQLPPVLDDAKIYVNCAHDLGDDETKFAVARQPIDHNNAALFMFDESCWRLVDCALKLHAALGDLFSTRAPGMCLFSLTIFYTRYL